MVTLWSKVTSQVHVKMCKSDDEFLLFVGCEREKQFGTLIRVGSHFLQNGESEDLLTKLTLYIFQL